MSTAYQTLTIELARNFLVKTMGFVESDDTGRHGEFVFAMPVAGCQNREIRVYSAISRQTLNGRANGSDAILIKLVDTETGKPVATAKRILRKGKNMTDRIMERCREMYQAACDEIG